MTRARIRRIAALVLGFALAAGCGGRDGDGGGNGPPEPSPDGGFPVVELPDVQPRNRGVAPGTGLLLGHLSFDVAGAFAVAVAENPVRIESVQVALVSSPEVSLCNQVADESVSFDFVVVTVAPRDEEPVRPGAYAIDTAFPSQRGVGVARGAFSNGQVVPLASYSRGTVTLNEVTATKVSGNFSVEFGDADGPPLFGVMGFFDAPLCEIN